MYCTVPWTVYVLVLIIIVPNLDMLP